MSDLFDMEIDSGSKCVSGHPIHLVAEGYGLCLNEPHGIWTAWALTLPTRGMGWGRWRISGRDGAKIPAWYNEGYSKERCLAIIQQDIDARRAMPFDEEAERARLMPV